MTLTSSDAWTHPLIIGAETETRTPELRTAPSGHAAVAAALADCRRSLWSVALFSGVVNFLMLAGPLYMLQIYDRVLTSRSIPTLVGLTAFLVGAYVFQGAFDFLRGRIVVRAAGLLDGHLISGVHSAVVRLGVENRRPGEAVQPVRDLDQIRAFLTGSGPIAIVDLSWVPLFLAFGFLLHPWLGAVGLAGACILFLLTIQTERVSRVPAREMAREASSRAACIEASRRNSESIMAMGMVRTLGQYWDASNERYFATTEHLSDVIGSYASLSKCVRLLLQSLILGVGAYLVIQNELTAGSMIAASIMLGRALAPVDVAVANWRPFISARQSARRLCKVLSSDDSRCVETALPRPSRDLTIEQLAVAAPKTDDIIVRNAHFQLNAGEALGIIGPSGAGKTSLVRAIAGIWRPLHGFVRLDGAALSQWKPETLGSYVGFVSQQVDLFDGTIADNIARMTVQYDSQAVLQAARTAGAHDMIVRLPRGYDTPIGEAGMILSAGQRQRIALARALYGDPFMVVLDEPQANLDDEGEFALIEALKNVKRRGALVIIVTHRRSALVICDKILLLVNGIQQAFGPREQVLQALAKRPLVPSANAPLKVVSASSNRRNEHS
jgi:ATP-binding cassette subfamily C protein